MRSFSNDDSLNPPKRDLERGMEGRGRRAEGDGTMTRVEGDDANLKGDASASVFPVF